MKRWSLGLVCAVSLLSGCATYVPQGILYTGVALPVTATPNEVATKKGVATAKSYLAMVTVGDASIEAAKKNGGISKVTHVDWHVENYLGAYAVYTVTVYGE